MESVPPSLVFNPVAIREPFAEKPSLPPSPQTAANPFLSRSRVLGHLFPCRFGAPTRREILEILKNGAMPAGEIAEHFSITGAAISRHLSVLKEADLVRDHRDGKFIFYDVNLSVLQEILVWIGNFKAARETSSGKQDKIIGTQPNH